MLELQKPVIVFDLETTGTSFERDRIIQIGAVKILPDGGQSNLCYLFNPGMLIPEQAIDIHGITNEAVKDAPFFHEKAFEIQMFFDNCDLIGYNLIFFDIPMLRAEFSRVKIPFVTEDRKVIDVQKIFTIHEPRTLAAAAKFYRCHEYKAHDAHEDAVMTWTVLQKQMEKYKLGTTVEELASICHPADWVDAEGKFKTRKDGTIYCDFGKYHGMTLREITSSFPDYWGWVLKSDFSAEVKEIVRKDLEEFHGQSSQIFSGKH